MSQYIAGMGATLRHDVDTHSPVLLNGSLTETRTLDLAVASVRTLLVEIE
jgi:hypothetical protein